MALIKCPECNKEVSDKAKTCPHCGYPFVNNEEGKNNVSINGCKYNISKIKELYYNISEQNQKRLYKMYSWQYRCYLNPELSKEKTPDFGGSKTFYGGDITEEICKTFNWWKNNDKMHLVYKFLLECINHNFDYFEFNTSNYEKSTSQPVQPTTASQNVVRCPRCGSTSVTTEEQGYGLFGWIGAAQKKNLCQKCGHKWWPGR